MSSLTYKLQAMILLAIMFSSANGRNSGAPLGEESRQRSLYSLQDSSAASPILMTSDTLYEDSLPPNSTKSYAIQVLEKAVLILCVTTNTREARLELAFEGPGSRIAVAFPPFPEDVQGFLYYLNGSGEAEISFMNLQAENSVDYRFFMDLSEPLEASNSKNVPLEGCPVAFHIDLKKDDELSMDLASHPNPDSQIEAEAHVLYFISLRGYVLRLLTETSNKHLRLTSDLVGRYYIIVRPGDDVESLSLTNMANSPAWNQEWFWQAPSVVFVIALSPWFMIKLRKLRNAEKSAKYTLISDYFSVLMLVLFSSVIGSYNSRTSTLLPLFYLSTLSSILSLGIQVYAVHLGRMNPIGICPHCLRELNLEKTSFCCGRKIKRISSVWYLAPLAFGFLFLSVVSSLFSSFLGSWLESAQPITTSLWIGAGGCAIGGIVAWAVNKAADKRKSWIFMILGVVSACVFPWLVAFLIVFTGLFLPVVEYEIYGGIIRRVVRVNTQPTVPFGAVFSFAVLAIALCYLLLRQVRMTVTQVWRTSKEATEPKLVS